MSRKSTPPDIELRKGVLSWFTYKKPSFFSKESYELAPLYWRCLKSQKSDSVCLAGYRSEQSRGTKPHINLVVNGCTIELLPPMLKAKGSDFPGNDNYLCIQTEDDKIVFLKAEGRLQRDEWFEVITEGIGDRKQPTLSNPMSATNDLSPSRLPLSTPDDDDNDGNSKKLGNVNEESALYHLPYDRGVEDMRCSTSTEEDIHSWSNTKCSPSLQIKQSTSDVLNDDQLSKHEGRDVDECGYVAPLPLMSQAAEHIEEEHHSPNNKSALRLELKDCLFQVKEKPRPLDDSPSKEPPHDRLHVQEQSPAHSTSPHMGSPRPLMPAHKRNNKPLLPDPPPKGGKESFRSQPHVRKPMKAPPPKPAGSKPKSSSGAEKPDGGLPQPPTIPRPKIGEPPAPSSALNRNESMEEFFKNFRNARLSEDLEEVEVSMTTVSESSLSIASIRGSLYVGGFKGKLIGFHLLVGDEIQRINEQKVSTVEAAYTTISSTPSDKVQFSVRRFPHGVLTFISHTQDVALGLKQLGLILHGPEVLMMESEGLVAKSGTPSRLQVPGITNDGSPGNWALTQINTMPIHYNAITVEVEEKLAEAGSSVALFFHPVDFAKALSKSLNFRK